MMHFHSRVFTSFAQLASCAARWNELVRLSPGNTLFLTWEWLDAWNTHVAGKLPLFIIAVFDEKEQPVAFLPLYQSSFKLFNLISYKCLRPMGDCHCGGEYPDIIAAPDSIADILTCIQDCLTAHRNQWDCLYVPYISGRTNAVSRFSLLNAAGPAFSRLRDNVFSSIALPESFEAYNKNMLGSFHSLIRRQKRKLEQLGNLAVILCQEEQEIPLFLDSLFRLHKKRWEAAGQPGSFVRRPLMQQFYTGFAATAFRKGWLKIFALQVDGVTLAVQIGYLYQGVFYQMQEGFDPEGTGGLGNVLRHAVMDWCIANNVQEYDYLGGSEEHKLKWGAKQHVGYTLFCGARSLKNRVLTAADIWPSGRFISEGPPVCYGYSHD